MGDTASTMEKSVRLRSVRFERLRAGRQYLVDMEFTTENNARFHATVNKEVEDNMRGFLARFGSFETIPNGGTMWHPRGA